MEIGSIIRQLRMEKGIKQEGMAEKIGISQSTYSRYESGCTRITTDILDKIAIELRMSVQEIYAKDHPPVSSTLRPEEGRSEVVYHSGIPEGEKELYGKLLDEKERQIQQEKAENKGLKDKVKHLEDKMEELDQEFRVQNEELLRKVLELEKESRLFKKVTL
jgi:transcriptional regulator with XRE-family HTH domain